MNFDFNITTLAYGIFDQLNADTIIKGSTYLDGTTKMFLFRAPREVVSPHLIIEIMELIPDEMSHYTSEIRIHIYNRLLSNGQIDFTSGHRITNRVESLLNNKILTMSGAISMPLISLGIIPLVYDESNSEEKAKSVVRLLAVVSKT